MWLRNLICGLVILLIAGCGESKLPSPFKASDVSSQYAQPIFIFSMRAASRAA
jgi:hypothetical protein